MKKIVYYIIGVLVILVSIASLSYYYNSDWYQYFILEDGVIENTTAIGLLLISVLFLYKLFSKGKEKTILWKGFQLFVCLLAFFGFGEEISWGQRIFEIQSTDYFTENNAQGEMNLHNLVVGGVKINKLLFSLVLTIVASIYFVFSSMIYKRVAWVKEWIDKIGLPLPKIEHVLWILGVTLIILIIPDHKKWEFWETNFVLIVLMTFLRPMNKKESLI